MSPRVVLFLSSLGFGIASPPNILFLLADDQGWGDVSYNAARNIQPGAGGARYTPNPPRTPHLDALASSPGTLVFDRFYSGSPVCSPTRSSLLTGRTPDRECIFNAEGCGQVPAWSCINPQPFPVGFATNSSQIFTVANAASRAGYKSLHSGKYHLGNFFPKKNPSPSFAYSKWPTATPAMAGFDEWFSTEASASSTMCNCGCNPAWPAEAPGCVIGGGVYVLNKSLECTNYWYSTNNSAACLTPQTATLECVTNSTVKIPGDDSLFQLARFNTFVDATVAAQKPFFVTMQLHTNHIPHPSLPEFYHAYNDTNGDFAGDYLGTLTQMDAAVGALIASLTSRNLFNNTIIFYAADNGPHPGTYNDGAGGIKEKNTATNGLRQCKASVFEGGIRVPGFVSWPAVIKANAHTSVPAFVPDFMPTILDILGIEHPHPEFAMDGESLRALLESGGTAPFNRTKFLAWALGAQVSLLEPTGRFKYVKNPEAGQCAQDNATYSYKSKTPFVFDLFADPTESSPITDLGRIAAMDALAQKWLLSITASQVNESQCLPSQATPFQLQFDGKGCLAAAGLAEHAAVTVGGACEGSTLNSWVTVGNQVQLATGGGWCFHTNSKETCAAGDTVWMGQHCAGAAFAFDDATGALTSPACPDFCAGVSGGSTAVSLVECTDPSATEFAKVVSGLRMRGLYVEKFD